MQPTEPNPANGAPRHETRDVNIRGAVVFCICLALAVLIVTVVLWGLYGVFSTQAERREPALNPVYRQGRARQEFPAPQLQPPPPLPGRLEDRSRPFAVDSVDLANMRQRERQTLDSYGWVDRSAGVVHIPIQRAMDMLVQQGLPARPAASAAPPQKGKP